MRAVRAMFRKSRTKSVAHIARMGYCRQMRFLGVAVILTMVGALLVSSGVAPVGPTVGPENAGPAPAADDKPVVARSRPEVQRSVLEDRDRDAALGLLLLIGTFEGRHGR